MCHVMGLSKKTTRKQRQRITRSCVKENSTQNQENDKTQKVSHNSNNGINDNSKVIFDAGVLKGNGEETFSKLSNSDAKMLSCHNENGLPTMQLGKEQKGQETLAVSVNSIDQNYGMKGDENSSKVDNSSLLKSSNNGLSKKKRACNTSKRNKPMSKEEKVSNAKENIIHGQRRTRANKKNSENLSVRTLKSRPENALKNKTNDPVLTKSSENPKKFNAEELINSLIEAVTASSGNSSAKETALKRQDKMTHSSSFTKNFCCYTSTPQKVDTSKEKNSSCFMDNSLFESEGDVSPIKAPEERECEEKQDAESLHKSFLSDVSCDDVQLFDDIEKNDLAAAVKNKRSITKPKKDCAASHCKKKLFKNDGENIKKMKREKKVGFETSKKEKKNDEKIGTSKRKVQKNKTEEAHIPSKKVKKQILTTEQLEEWAFKINADFEQVDKYELIVE